MPYLMTVTENVTSLGAASGSTVNISSQNIGGSSPTLAVAKTGTLDTRTDNDTGVIGAEVGHGIISTDKVDVFWDGGQRRNMTATVAGDNITVDGGTGDNLPDADTEMTFMKPNTELVTVIGDNIIGIHIYSDRKGFVVFQQADGTHITAFKMGDDGDQYIWYDETDLDNPKLGANPLAGVTVGKILTSHDDAENTHAPMALLYYN